MQEFTAFVKPTYAWTKHLGTRSVSLDTNRQGGVKVSEELYKRNLKDPDLVFQIENIPETVSMPDVKTSNPPNTINIPTPDFTPTVSTYKVTTSDSNNTPPITINIPTPEFTTPVNIPTIFFPQPTSKLIEFTSLHWRKQLSEIEGMLDEDLLEEITIYLSSRSSLSKSESRILEVAKLRKNANK